MSDFVDGWTKVIQGQSAKSATPTPDAASLVERLQDHYMIDRADPVVKEAADRIAALEARVRELEEGLRPFAAMSQSIDELPQSFPDDESAFFYTKDPVRFPDVTWRDFRRARALVGGE